MRLSQLMMIPPFIYDIKGISVYLEDFEEPSKSMIILSTNNVWNLTNIIKATNPQFSQFKIPEIGKGPQKPEGIPVPSSLNVMMELEKMHLDYHLVTYRPKK